VRFEKAIRTVLEQNYPLLLEISPHPVLVMSVQDIIDDSGSDAVTDAVTWGTLRREEGGLDRFLLALAEAHIHGARVDWSAVFAGSGARRVDLPTYAFQPDRFWLAQSASSGDASSLGLVAAGHPLLGAEIALPDSGGMLLTGRVSLRTHPWLADHAVMGTILVPGTAFMELAFRAADELGCTQVDELTVQSPLLLEGSGGVALQVVVGGPQEDGQRQFTIYSRPEPTEGALDDVDWTCHVIGWLSAGAVEAPRTDDLMVWPPQNAQAFSAEEVYERLVARDYGYGPVFQGLRGAWVRGNEVFAEVSLPQQTQSEAARFGLHPALFDAAFHALIAAQPVGEQRALRLPFSWTGVKLFDSGASSMRVRMDITSPDTVSVTAVDDAGRLVVSVDSLLLREISGEKMTMPVAGGRHHKSLFQLDWASLPLPASAVDIGRWSVLGDSPVTNSLVSSDSAVSVFDEWSSLADFVGGGGEVPDVVVVPVDSIGGAVDGTDVPGGVRQVVGKVLAQVQQWLADNRFDSSRMVVITRKAMTVGDVGSPDITQAPVWGLLRSAQSENPDRLMLLDIDDEDTSLTVLQPAVATAMSADELQVAIRDGELLVARLARVPVAADAPETSGRPIDPQGTVLVTGASGLLAGLVARHVVQQGARHVVLASRRGDTAPGSADLVATLVELGAEVTVAACDVADRDALAAVLAAIPGEHPLTAVIHGAGVLDDGVIGSLTLERLDTVWRPKVDAVWNLHELTKDDDLAVFAIFSSAAGTLGGGGQGSYSAANAFLDALARHRRANGLVASSLAWGMWDSAGDSEAGGGTSHLGATDLSRVNRGGLLPLSVEQGMALFDTVTRLEAPVFLPMRMDIAGMRAAGGVVPSIMRGLIRAPVRRRADVAPQSSSSLSDRLAVLSTAERDRFMVELVRGQAAAVLGHASAQVVQVDEAFRELGFDSLTAVELRNRLKTTTGLTLPATLVFDHPSPRALARFLLAELVPEGAVQASPAQVELDKLEAALASVSQDEAGDTQVTERLNKILATWTRNQRPSENALPTVQIGTASVDEIFDFIDGELGRSRN
jgi:acyl transferase domain-containing protein/acyl carrier protein